MNEKFTKVALDQRIYARLIDIAIFWFIYAALSIFVGNANAALISYLFFFLPKDGFNKGRGVGKNYRNIVVINSDTLELCNYPRSIFRNIISDLSIVIFILQFGNDLLYIQIFVVIVTLIDIWRIKNSEGGQRVGDVLAHTQVIYWEDYQKLKSTITGSDAV